MRQETERQVNWREVIFEITDVRLPNGQQTIQAANQGTPVAAPETSRRVTMTFRFNEISLRPSETTLLAPVYWK